MPIIFDISYFLAIFMHFAAKFNYNELLTFPLTFTFECVEERKKVKKKK